MSAAEWEDEEENVGEDSVSCQLRVRGSRWQLCQLAHTTEHRRPPPCLLLTVPLTLTPSESTATQGPFHAPQAQNQTRKTRGLPINTTTRTHLECLVLPTVLLRVFCVVALISFLLLLLLIAVFILRVIGLTVAVLAVTGAIGQRPRLAAAQAASLRLSFVGFLSDIINNTGPRFVQLQIGQGGGERGEIFFALLSTFSCAF